MMNYCMDCGTKLELRHLENEGKFHFAANAISFVSRFIIQL